MKPKGMTDAPKSPGILFVILCVCSLINECSSSKISDLRLCGDKECKTTLSYGRTLAKHVQNDPVFLNFERNEMLEITSKSAGDRPDLWGGRLNGKTGYFPRSFVREYKVENPSPQFIVPTEISEGKNVVIEEKPAKVPDKAEEGTEVDDSEDEDDTEVEDEDDDVWWEEDEVKEATDKTTQKDQEKPATPPSSASKEKEKDKNVEEVKVTQTGGKDSEDVKVTDSQNSDNLKQGEVAEEKDEPKEPAVTDVKDPTEVGETKEGNEGTEKKTVEDSSSQIHVKKENRVKELLDELRESLYSLHDIDDKDKLDVNELNKMLQEGSAKQQPETTVGHPPPAVDGKTELNQEKSDDASPDTKSQEDVKLPGLSDLLKDTPEDASKSPQDDKSLEKDDTEITDETEIGNEESGTEQKQETPEDAGKEDAGKHPGGIPVNDVEDLPPSQQEQTKREIQPSSVKQEKVEETPLQSSFTEEMSTTPSSEVKASSSSHTPGLTGVPSSVTESSTVVEASQQTEMAGYTIIDGTPFPLDMFEDPTATESVVEQTENVVEQTKLGTFSSTQSQVDSSSVSPDKTIKSPATEKQETESTLQSQIPKQSSVMPSLTETLSESMLVGSGSSPADVVPTQTDTDSKSAAVQKEDDADSIVQVDTDVGAGKKDGSKQVEDTEQLDITDLEKSVESKKEEIKRTEESKETKEDPKVEDQIQEKVDTPEATEKESLTNISNSEEKINENQQKSQELGIQNDQQTEQKEEDKKQTDLKESEEKAEKPNLSVLKFLDDEETSSEVPSSDENVKEMEIPSEEVKTEKEKKKEQLSQELTEKPIQEQTTASGVPSTSPTEQLMSSMEIDYSVETKTIIDDTRNTGILGEQQNATQTVVETDNLKLELPTTMDAYATADFLSRKPLSHEPHTEMSQSQNLSEKLEVKEKGGDEMKKETVTQASPETTQTESTAETKFGETKSESVTVSPLESTTLSGSDDGEIPPPPTESKETTTQPGTGQSSEESPIAAKDDKEDSKPTTGETVGVTESTPEGERASTGAYDQEDFLSRKINDGDLEEKEDLAYKAERSWMKGDQFFRGVISKLPPSLQALLEQEPLGLSPQMTILVTMVTLATLMAVTCFSVICGGGRKSKKQDPVVVVRGLEEKLFILTKEKENLEDELNALQQKMQDTEEDTKSTQSSVSTIQKDLQTLQLHNNTLKEEIETLKEENTSMKQELSAKSKELKSKDNQLKELEKQIKQKDEKYNKTNEKCKEATKEVQEKAGEIKTLKSQIHSLTEQVSHLEANKSQLSEEANVWSEKVQELTEQLDYVKGEQKQMAEDLAYKENEIEVLRDCFLQLKAFQDQVGEEGEEGEGSRDETDSGNIESKLKSMMDVSEVSAKLKAAEEEKNSLENRLEIEMQSRRDMEERILDLERKAESLNSDKMKAERQNSDAQTKLEVLSNYFKQKELELQRELGEQEALKKMNINKLENSDTRTKMMQEELDGSKAQVEDLKREILSAERDFRSQIAANEKKAHENWLAARAAERELKESRHEASVLRQKLTDLERRLMQGPPGGLIRPVPSRGMPPPGMLNGPPPPGMERPGSRGRLPPTGPRDEDFPGSPGPDSERRPPPPLGPDDRRIPPFNPDDRRMPFHDDRRIPPMEGPDRRQTPMGPRVPPPHPMDIRSPPPFDRRPPPPLDRRSPPPYERGLRLPPPPLDRRSPGQRMPFPPDMPPHLRGPPRGPLSPPLRNDGHGIDTPPYRPPHDPDREPRQQSQV